MKVLVISSKYPPEYAGSGYRAHNTYLRLQNDYDIEFDVICNSLEFGSPEVYSVDGVNVTRVVNRFAHTFAVRDFSSKLSERTAMAIKLWTEALATWRHLENRSFDIVHTFGNSASTAMAHYWTRHNDIPLLSEVCNVLSTPYQYLPIASRFWEYNLSRQSVVVALSPEIESMCRDHGLKRNVWMRPNPVEANRFSPKSVWGRKQVSDLTKFTEDDTVILYVAAFVERKHHAFLLDVLQQLPKEYKLLLAGPVDSKGKIQTEHERVLENVQQRIQELECADRVDLQPGFVDMADYLSIADVFCFPAQDEAMGTPLLESLCSGVPVVATAGEASFERWLSSGKNGFLRPHQPDLWASAIKQCVAFDHEEREAFAMESLERFSSDVIDRQYYKILKGLVECAPKEVFNVAATVNQY